MKNTVTYECKRRWLMRRAADIVVFTAIVGIGWLLAIGVDRLMSALGI